MIKKIASPSTPHHIPNMFQLNFAYCLLHSIVRGSVHTAALDQNMHLLTLVVRCGFPKPLTVAPLTISLVDSLLQSVLLCVKFSCLPAHLTETLMALFTIHGSRQATEAKSHGQDAIRKSFVSAGATAEVYFLSSQHHDNNTELQGTMGWQRNCTPQKPTENTPFTRATYSDQPTLQRGNHLTHTPFLSNLWPDTLAAITKLTHRVTNKSVNKK